MTNAYKIICCGKCGQKLRIPANKQVLATCPKCNYSFKTSPTIKKEEAKPRSYIDELRPKQQKEVLKKQGNEETKETIETDYTHKLCIKIESMIKKMVRDNMLKGGSPPNIHHYFYSITIDNEYEESLDVMKFTVFSGNGSLDLLKLKNELELIIRDRIGYTYCEVRLEDKICKEDYQVKELFGSGLKWKTRQYRGKAIWIRASMDKSTFSKAHSEGGEIRYDKRRGFS